MKRRGDNSSASAIKKVRFSEDTIEEATFTPDNVPENYFHVGGSKYVVISDFADVVRVHLRLYKIDPSGRLQPTKKGITMSPAVWESFSNARHSPKPEIGDLEIIEGSIMLSAEQIDGERYFCLQRFFQKQDFSRKFVPSVCLLNETEWCELRNIQKKVSSAIIPIMFGRVFRHLLKQEVQSRTPSPPVEEEDNETGEMILTSMTELLKDYLETNIGEIFQCNGCEAGWENQLGHECLSTGNSFRADVYGERAILRIDLKKFVNDFVERNIQLSYVITENFINSLNMSCLIKSAVNMYIASDPDPWRLI